MLFLPTPNRRWAVREHNRKPQQRSVQPRGTSCTHLGLRRELRLWLYSWLLWLLWLLCLLHWRRCWRQWDSGVGD